MKRFKVLLVLAFFALACTHCATQSAEDIDDAAGIDHNTPNADADLEADTTSGKKDDFADFDDSKTDQPQQQVQQNQKDDFAEFDDDKKEEAQQSLKDSPPETPAPEVAQEAPAPLEPPAAIEPPPPAPEPPAEAQTTQGTPIHITAIQFKANDNGGTVVVEADGPMTYTSHMSETNGQFVIEIPNSILPSKLSHPLITKEFEGIVSSIEAYQSAGTTTSRVVLQLMEGATEPVVQSEGSSLLVVANTNGKAKEKVAEETNEVRLLSFNSLEEFMAGNMMFSGKKISIESEAMDVADLFRLISDEVGVNLVIADDVKGTMAVKLRQVPWDQALVMIMKAKRLSFTRSGNVLRIATLEQLRSEEDQVIKLLSAKREVSPLVVKVIPISYAKISELTDQIKPFLDEKRGRVVGDPRTSSLVISDSQENIDRIAKLVQSIDIAPQQVLIEGKIVEAQETFQRQVGINWSDSNISGNMGSSQSGNVIGMGGINVTPGTVNPSYGSLNFSLGTLDIFGNLSAMLSLQEQEGTVKVLSSPRVVTMHNEPAVISQTQEIPLITAVATTGVSSTQVNFKPVKLELAVTPNITNDGSVIMGVQVTREYAGPAVDIASNARPINSRAAKTKVMVRNGQTAVIGGIYQDDATEGENRVPWLGSIPVLGWLFKSQNKSDTKNELLIFLTPRILGQLDSQLMPESGSSKTD